MRDAQHGSPQSPLGYSLLVLTDDDVLLLDDEVEVVDEVVVVVVQPARPDVSRRKNLVAFCLAMRSAADPNAHSPARVVFPALNE